MAAGLRALLAALLLVGARGVRRASPPRRAAAAVLAVAVARGAGAEVFGADGLPEATGKEFRRLDADGDGRLDLEEYLGAARATLELMEGLNDAEEQKVLEFYSKLFADADLDQDGFFGAREFELAEFIHDWTAGTRFSATLSRLHRFHRDVDFSYLDIDEFGAAYRAELFEETDLNGDGVIQKDEYLVAMRDTAVQAWKWDGYLDDPEVVDWMDGLWERVDITGDGTLNAKELQYTAFLAEREIAGGLFADRAMANTIFEELDVNKDGIIGKAEAESVFEEIERDLGIMYERQGTGRGVNGGTKISDDRFAEADTNGDGVLDRAEVLVVAGLIINDLTEIDDPRRAFEALPPAVQR